MAIYPQKEFAALVGMPTGRLTIYANRGKVIIKNKTIDTSIDKNEAFLEKYRTKNDEKEVKPDSKKNKSVPPANQNDPPGDPSPDQKYSESERQLKYLDTLKRKMEIEKIEIENAKKRGEVIPSQLLAPVILQHNQSIVTQFKIAVDDLIRIFGTVMSLNTNDIAEIRGKCYEAINHSVDKASENTVNSIKTIIIDYSNKRGVGERTS
jgi:hypothetical protein